MDYADTEIYEMIDFLEHQLENKCENNYVKKSIKNPKGLINALEELLDLIEMKDVKIAMVNQIKLVLSLKFTGKKINNHMLNCVISGNPGVGKTTVAKIIAKIYNCIGLLNPKKPPVVNNVSKDKLMFDMMKDFAGEYNRMMLVDLKKKIRKLEPQFYKTNREKNKWHDLFSTITQYQRDNETLFCPVIENLNVIPNTNTNTNTNTNSSTDDNNFIVATRSDLVGRYVGETAIKTKKVLESAMGGVLFIDEAYSICTSNGSSRDSFGEESLTTINEFMSKYPNDIIIIFAGYKNKLESTIFKIQPGLNRRCTFRINIDDYDIKTLSRIFEKRVDKDGWSIDQSVNVENILKNNSEKIQDNGGGIEKLVFFCKLAYGKQTFDLLTQNADQEFNQKFNSSIIYEAINMLCKNSEIKNDTPPLNMYM